MKFNKLSIAALFLSVSLMAQQQGANIVYSITSDKGATGNMEMYYQNGNSRMEMEFKIAAAPTMAPVKMVTLVQADKPKTSIQLNADRKTYTEVTQPEMDKKTETKEKEYVVTVIGKEKIGAYNCTHVKVKADRADYEMWLTKDITPTNEYYKSDNKYVGNENMQKALVAKQADGFPVKTIFNESGGREGMVTMTLTRYEKMNVPADKFQIPAGYVKTTMAIPTAIPSQQEIMNMTPEQREKFIEQMKNQYGGVKGGN